MFFFARIDASDSAASLNRKKICIANAKNIEDLWKNHWTINVMINTNKHFTTNLGPCPKNKSVGKNIKKNNDDYIQ